MATISFEIHAVFREIFHCASVNISFSVSFSTAAIFLNISLLIDRYFIQYFIVLHSLTAPSSFQGAGRISEKGNAHFYKSVQGAFLKKEMYTFTNEK
jgi:hypothetical protein